MATGHGGDDGESWWGGWIQAAKQKSSVALEQMKRDLGEFGSTLQKDTSSMVATSAGVIRDSLQTDQSESSSSRVKQTFSNLLSGLSESLAPKDPGTEEEHHSVPSKTSHHHIFDRAKARLHAMQIDAGTYCTDPEDPSHAYEDWLQSFNPDKYKGDISDLLVANTDVRAIYTKLVPAVVSNADFWGRYFYKVQQLKQDEARRAALKERADMTSSRTFDEEELQWDDDEEESSDPLHIPVHEGKNITVKPAGDEDRIPNLASSLVYAEEQGNEESNHDSQDELAVNTARPTHTRQSGDIHVGKLQPLTEPKTEQSDQEDETTELPTTKHEGETNNWSSSQTHGGLVSVKQEQDDTKISRLGGEETHSTKTSSDECREDAICSQSEDHAGTPTHDTESRGPNTDTLMVHVSPEETSSDKQSEKKISPSGSDADSSLSDDWERDFDDIDVTDEDLAAAAIKTRQAGVDGYDVDDLDDWESWE